MDKEFLVISEGTTDFEVLKAVIPFVGNSVGQKYRAKALWPSDRYAQKAGWSSMKSWCQEQASTLIGNDRRLLAAAIINPKLGSTTIRRSASADKIGAALAISSAGHRRQLVLQIDADIAEYLLNECVENQALAVPLSIAQRRVACENALATWLGGHAGKIGSGILLCVSTFALETWILATHQQSEILQLCNMPIVVVDYDHLTRPDKFLLALGYAGDGSGPARELRKSKGLYTTYGEKIVANFEAARSRSTSLNGFCLNVCA